MTGHAEAALHEHETVGAGERGAEAGAVGLHLPGRDQASDVREVRVRGSICFDFDGVIVAYYGYKPGAVGRTIPGAIDALKASAKAGFRTVIFTARTDGLPQKWVEKHGLQSVIDQVTNVKPKDCVRFFDDRAHFIPPNSPYALSLALASFLGAPQLETTPLTTGGHR